MRFNYDVINNGRDSVTKGALIVASFGILSRFLGLLRDRLLASTWGANEILDAYYAAFKIPDFIFNSLVLGALASALIPIFIQYRENKGTAQAYELVNKILNLLIVVLLGAAVMAAIASPWLVKIIAPGFSLYTLTLTSQLTRVMLLAVVIFGASNVLSSVLQAQQRLTAFALAPVLYNVGIIAGLILFVPMFGPYGLAWGVVLGSLLHLLVQLPAMRKINWRWQPLFSFKDTGVRQVLALLGPRTLGLVASQINQIITVGFVSSLAVGSLAAFSLALNLHSFSINVFGVSLAIAVFPLLSQAFSTSQPSDFIHHFSLNLRRILFYVMPLSVLFLVLRAQLVRVVLGSGAFDWSDTIATAQVLGFLALAIVSDSLLPLVARAFYALKDTKTPVIAALVSITVNFALLFILRPFALSGVGIAYVCSSVIYLVILIAILGQRLGNLGSSWIIAGIWQMVLGSLVAGSAAYGTLYLVAPQVDMNTFIGIFTQGLLAGLAGVVSYLVISLAFNLAEIHFVRRWLASAWQSLSNKHKPSLS